MRRTPMFVRPLRRLSILAAASISVAALLSPHDAAATEIAPTTTLQCSPSAPVYTISAGGGLWLYPHLEPETGAFSWAPQQMINSVFAPDAKRLAGPNGVFYSIVSTGEVRRRHWTGTGWDTFAGGSQYEIIDTNPGWARYLGADYQNRITVDSDGYIYTVEPDGNLHWYLYDAAAHSWTRGILESGWGQYNLIVAAGPGVIYGRKPSGALFRSTFHTPSQRFIDIRPAGTGWEMFSRMFSVGGDILYGVRSSIGDLLWYRYNEDTNTWAFNYGIVVGTGWGSEFESFAAPDSCRRVGGTVPSRPAIPLVENAPVTLLRSSNGHVHYSYVDSEGRAVYADIASVLGGGPAAAAAVPGMVGVTGITSTGEQQDGRIQLVATGLNSEIYSNTRNSTTWSQTTSLGGFVLAPAVLTRQANGTLDLFALEDEPDEGYHLGYLWYRPQAGVNGPLNAWRDAESAGASGRGRLVTVLPTSNGVRRIVDGGWCVEVETDTDTGMGIIAFCGIETGYHDGASALLMPDNTLQLFATGLDGHVQTIRQRVGEDAFGDWPDDWTILPGITGAGPPTAIMAPDGKLKVVVRATDDYLYYTTETTPGSFAPWQEITNFSEPAATDPTALAVPDANTWVIAYRDDLDRPRLRRYQPPTLTTAPPFTPVPITAPAG